jgi:hypothetical protein
MKQIEVFKTNVSRKKDAVKIIRKLTMLEPNYSANFDIQDCDHILRIESNKKIHNDSVIALLKYNNYNCEII